MNCCGDSNRQKSESARGMDEVGCHNCRNTNESISQSHDGTGLGFVYGFLILFAIIGGIIVIDYLI